MTEIKALAQTSYNTVLASYESQKRTRFEAQSEAELEKQFIDDLVAQGYKHAEHIKDEDALIANLRVQIEKLNNVQFSDSEWARFFNDHLVKKVGVLEKTKIIQEEPKIDQFQFDDPRKNQNIWLIKKGEDLQQNNRLQVINQYRAQGGRNRYDVTILVNGLPLVHIELKRRGSVPLKEAFNQIERYWGDSFSGGAGLFDFVQIFVISNGTFTKYYSNTTRQKTKEENSFGLTSFWADFENQNILDLEDFTRTFLCRETLLNVLTRYCVFTADRVLKVMRPYQISATEAILSHIQIHPAGDKNARGYIWHTTGSGKTLTSFKTAKLATELPYIDKVLFVVDRKDLDTQTQQEYENFQKNSANATINARELQKCLEDDSKIVITTIQKLAKFIKNNPQHSAVYAKSVVFIFDECHRSQFGKMHQKIVQKFKKHYLFGFTGTPIFAENSMDGKTTALLFGTRLHSYTIIDAIRDDNVLKFSIEYLKNIHAKENIKDEKVEDINRKGAFEAPQRVAGVVKFILENFDRKCARPNTMGQRQFNSILAVDSIDMAQKYYLEFQKQIQEIEDPAKKLKVATIFSSIPNEATPDYYAMEDENNETAAKLNDTDRNFLRSAIADYNKMTGNNYSVDDFQGYYKSISENMKAQKLDILIVVNMFLTGFDAKTVHALWVDKNLKMHGLIQAFSRTNRLCKNKFAGRIYCFRPLEKEVDQALRLFTRTDHPNTATGDVFRMPDFETLYSGQENGMYTDDKGEHESYKKLVEELKKYPAQMVSETQQAHFARDFGKFLKMHEMISELEGFVPLLNEDEIGAFNDKYLHLHEKITAARKAQAPLQADIVQDLIFEIDLIKKTEINVDYLLALLEKNTDKAPQEKKETELNIERMVRSSPSLRSKRKLIKEFMDHLNSLLHPYETQKQWAEFIREHYALDFNEMVAEHRLQAEGARKILHRAFKMGELQIAGKDLDDVLPPMTRRGNVYETTRQNVIDALQTLFERYSNTDVALEV